MRHRCGQLAHGGDARDVRQFSPLLQGLGFGLFASGEVHNGGQDKNPFRSLNLAQAEFNREFRPVLAHGEQLSPGDHGLRL